VLRPTSGRYGTGEPGKLDSMPGNREAIPNELQRQLFVEAGYRCAIPTCRAVAPLQIEHIDDYAKVKEHKFENMIVLCANCHGMKGSGPRQLDRKALRQFKANLGLLNHRYGDLERRLLEDFAQNPDSSIRILPGSMDLLVRNLVRDGYLKKEKIDGGRRLVYGKDEHEGIVLVVPDFAAYSLTDTGRVFVKNWTSAQPLPT
jgi:HNH endonuclease